MYLTQDETKALLGRSLTDVEINNFNLYQEIAITRLEDLLCRSLDDVITALGVESLPNDLKLVLARLFGCLSAENAVEVGVESKRVEDFDISYNENINNIYALTVQSNSQAIMKYAKCYNIRHGRTLLGDFKYYDGIR